MIITTSTAMAVAEELTSRLSAAVDIDDQALMDEVLATIAALKSGLAVAAFGAGNTYQCARILARLAREEQSALRRYIEQPGDIERIH